MTGRGILLLPVGDATVASTRYRVLAHVPALEADGWATRVRFPLAASGHAWLRRATRGLDLLRDTTGRVSEDLLFIHRKTYPGGFARRLKRAARPVVFDMDDALDLPPPSNQATEHERLRYRENFERTVLAADLVICGNRELTARLPHDRFEVLPTAIDTERFHPSAVRSSKRPVLGWVGHSDNLRYLERLAGPLREVARRHPAMRIVVVADRPCTLPGLDVEFRPWSLSSEISCFDGIRVGLMPLGDDPWTRSKCAFKAIQYMALGIPTIASPVGMNCEVIRDGESGFLPEDDAAWVRAMDALLTDEALTLRIGLEGRRVVERGYALEKVSRALVTLLRDLVR